MDFNFSSQHHAQVISEDDNKVVLTLVDNAADDFGRQAQTANTSAVKMVMIDSEKKNATVSETRQMVSRGLLILDSS